IDAYNTYKDKKINTTAVFDFAFNVIKGNIPADYWSGGDTAELTLPTTNFKNSIDKLNETNLSKMDDVHFWPFADYQFLKFLYDMDRAGFNDFDIQEFYQTQFNTQEFMVVLTRKEHNETNPNRYQKIARDLCPENKLYKANNKVNAMKDDISGLKDK